MASTVCDNCNSLEIFERHRLRVIDNKYIGVICSTCGYNIKFGLLAENILGLDEQNVLKIGNVVRIVNKEHVWNDEIAIIVGIKPLFYRIEIKGYKTWVPKHWISLYEPPEFD